MLLQLIISFVVGGIASYIVYKFVDRPKFVGIIGISENGQLKLDFKVPISSFMDDKKVMLLVDQSIKNALREEN